MEKKTKFIVLGLVCIVATAVLFSLQIYTAKNALEEKIKLFGNENSLLSQKNLEIISEIRNFQGKIAQLNLQLERTALERKDNQEKIDGVTQELAEEKKSKTRMQEGLDDLKGQNTLLRSQLDLLNKRKGELETNLLSLRSDEQMLKDRVARMQALLKAKPKLLVSPKLQQNASVRSQVVVSAPIVVMSVAKTSNQGRATPAQEAKKVFVKDLPVVSPVSAAKVSEVLLEPGTKAVLWEPAGAQKVAAGEAKVLVVNRENNFVIIDIGEQGGVNRGDKFHVYRGGKPIASLEVIRTRKSVSACDIKNQDGPILTGDIVRG